MVLFANTIALVAQIAEPQSAADQGSHIVLIIGITLAAFLLVCVGMAIGVLFGRRPISGSCGGLGNVTNEAGETSCALCQNPGDACKELRKRMDTSDQPS